MKKNQAATTKNKQEIQVKEKKKSSYVFSFIVLFFAVFLMIGSVAAALIPDFNLTLFEAGTLQLDLNLIFAVASAVFLIVGVISVIAEDLKSNTEVPLPVSEEKEPFLEKVRNGIRAVGKKLEERPLTFAGIALGAVVLPIVGSIFLTKYRRKKDDPKKQSDKKNASKEKKASKKQSGKKKKKD